MASTLSKTAEVAPVLKTNPKPTMAKADLTEVRKANLEDRWRKEIGKAVKRLREKSGLNLDEFADLIGKNSRLVYRWETGEDNVQTAAIFAVEPLRAKWVIALAEIVNGPHLEVITTISVREAL